MPNSYSAVCVFACAPIRASPSHTSEMSSQMLFGETCQVFESESKGFFGKIITDFDHYEGWVDLRLLERMETIPAGDTVYLSDALTAEIRLPEAVKNFQPSAKRHFPHSRHLLPMGSLLHHLAEGGFSCNGRHFVMDGPLRTVKPANSISSILDYAMRFLNAPYVWGGRTPWGIDCSGLVQQAFRAFGISLLRDTSQQITQGTEVSSLDKAQPGDLAFFGEPTDHVGLILPDGDILHSSGCVRLDQLDKNGIIHSQSGAVTHRLTKIRRVWQSSEG